MYRDFLPMGYIKNFDSLVGDNEKRKVVLTLVEAAFASIEPHKVMEKSFVCEGDTLKITDKIFPLSHFERIFVLGFGKGSSGICKIIEQKLGDKLTRGFDIDVVDETFSKIEYTKGTHPLPSQTNIDFTKNALSNIKDLTEKDLVLVVICGGGSVMFEEPKTVDLETLTKTVKALLNSGANIAEMNVIRKHLSRVKGGQLAGLLYPATVASLIFSDVPGNDLSVIASGPTTKDATTVDDANKILEKYKISEHVTLPENAFSELPHDDKYFEKVSNNLVVSNLNALNAMQEKAKELGFESFIYSDHLQGDARELGHTLISAAQSGKILLAGGESTIKITGSGKGGRNQALILSAWPHFHEDTVLVAFDSDGWDFYGYSGAIGDREMLEKARLSHVNPDEYLERDDSFGFFEKIGGGIDTGKLESNVSDLFIVLEKK